nr:hypothetical protein [Sulfurimonas sp.]
MLFKNIENFNDLHSIEEKQISTPILDCSTNIKEFKTIDITTLEYDSQLSRIIFNLIKTIQSKEQEYFDKCFKNSLEYLQNTKIDYINNFTNIINMLF